MTRRHYQNLNESSQRDALILENMSLVKHILGKMACELPNKVDLDNLKAAGILGLVEAANRYDPTRGIPFSTFAYNRIRGEIYDELRRNCPYPQEMLERMARIRNAMQVLPPPISIDSLSAFTGMTEDTVTSCLAAIRQGRVLSWDEIPDPHANKTARAVSAPEARIEGIERKEMLIEAIARLPEQERLTVTLYITEDLRLKEIGVVLGLSESRVSRLLAAALFNIREYLRAREEQAA